MAERWRSGGGGGAMAVAEQRRWQNGGAWATATEDWRRGPRRHRERKAAKAHTAAEQDGDAAHIYRGGTGEEQERVMGEGRAREEGKQLQRGRPSARERWQ